MEMKRVDLRIISALSHVVNERHSFHRSRNRPLRCQVGVLARGSSSTPGISPVFESWCQWSISPALSICTGGGSDAYVVVEPLVRGGEPGMGRGKSGSGLGKRSGEEPTGEGVSSGECKGNEGEGCDVRGDDAAICQ